MTTTAALPQPQTPPGARRACANDFEKVLAKRSTLMDVVDSLKRCHLALKQAQRIFTAGAHAFNGEAYAIGQCTAAL